MTPLPTFPRRLVELTSLGVAVLTSTGCGAHVHLGAGIARGGTSVGGETNSAFGPAFSLRAGVPDRPFGLVAAVDVQPFRVSHPYADEAFRIVYLVPSVQMKPGPVMIRGGVGLGFSSWSGSDRISASETGPALGAEVEVPIFSRTSRWFVALSFKGATTSDGEMTMSLLSLNLARRLF